jgi:very-short-patch-repair endonuclease
MEAPMQTDIHRDHARTMRKTMNRAEVYLWVRLRRRQLEGFMFHRQAEAGPYIVDFLCRESKLIVEVDGALHLDAVRYDVQRTVFLEGKGFRVIRFLNEEVYGDIEDVVERIVLALKQPTR